MTKINLPTPAQIAEEKRLALQAITDDELKEIVIVHSALLKRLLEEMTLRGLQPIQKGSLSIVRTNDGKQKITHD